MTKQPLALSNSKVYLDPLGQVMAQKLFIPQILGVSQLSWRMTQIVTDMLANTSIQNSWESKTLNLMQSGETALLKTVDLILYSKRTVPGEICHFGAAISGGEQ